MVDDPHQSIIRSSGRAVIAFVIEAGQVIRRLNVLRLVTASRVVVVIIFRWFPE